MSRDPETSAASSPRTSAPSRRTILTGAAWSVPVIAAASIAPIASASGVTALAFDKATYSGTACGTITGAYVTATVGGVASAGKAVTVTLSGGYTFSGGATTYTGVSDGAGKLTLPAINVPSVGGNGTLSAVSGSSTASASASAPAVKNALWREPNGSTSALSFPAQTTVPGDQTFLTPSGDLYLGQGIPIASGVYSSSAISLPGYGWAITYLDANGTGGARDWNGGVEAASFPPGTVVCGDRTYLTPAGDLYLGPSQVVASHVVSASTQAVANVGWFVTYVQQDGTAVWKHPTGNTITVSLPVGTKVVGDSAFLTPAGDLYLGTSHVASGVYSASSQIVENVGWYMTWIDANGSAKWKDPTASPVSMSFPAGTTVHGDRLFLTPTGDLYDGPPSQVGSKVASNVTSAWSQVLYNVGWYVTVVSSPSC